MIHPDTELRHIDERVGLGVVATRLIPRGTITWAGDALDQVLSPARVEALPALLRAVVERYAYYIVGGDRVLCWDAGRYVNHSCDPNCASPGWNFEIAVRDIHPGEQLTDDYASHNVTNDFACTCGAPVCRGRALPDDVERLAARWDALVAQAFPAIRSVPQPLLPLLPDPAAIDAVLAGERPIPSSRDNLIRREAAAPTAR